MKFDYLKDFIFVDEKKSEDGWYVAFLAMYLIDGVGATTKYGFSMAGKTKMSAANKLWKKVEPQLTKNRLKTGYRLLEEGTKTSVIEFEHAAPITDFPAAGDFYNDIVD